MDALKEARAADDKGRVILRVAQGVEDDVVSKTIEAIRNAGFASFSIVTTKPAEKSQP